jgi:hypothetical protein
LHDSPEIGRFDRVVILDWVRQGPIREGSINFISQLLKGTGCFHEITKDSAKRPGGTVRSCNTVRESAATQWNCNLLLTLRPHLSVDIVHHEAALLGILDRYYCSFWSRLCASHPHHTEVDDIDSIITTSCLRVQTLTRCASTRNPTYDTLASGTWSNVELNVGVIWICMPAFRRFLAYTLPSCFVSKRDRISLHDKASKAQRQSSNGNKGNKKKGTLPDSLFQTTIMKTVDTRVFSIKPEDDELQLVEMVAERATASSSCSVRGHTGAEVSYKAQH